FLRITFSIAQAMMKPAGLKRSARAVILRKPVLPKPHPLFDREFEIARRARHVEMIGHQKVIADEPCSRGVFPNAVQCALHRSLCQPAPSFLCANGEKNPIRSAR